MRTNHISTAAAWVVAIVGLGAAVRAAVDEAPAATTMRVGVVQLALEPELTANRDKLVAFCRQASEARCRVVIFPETALYSPPETPASAIDAAVADVVQAADDNDVYAVFGVFYRQTDGEQQHERLMVVDPEGRVLQTYDKLWGNHRSTRVPPVFSIDGLPASTIACADRWIRGVEDLPAAAGSKLLIECSNNYACEWLPDLGWFWYAPRAVRNGAFVVFANTARKNAQGDPGHGHSAVFAPDGTLLAAAGDEGDRLLVADLNLDAATRGETLSRLAHPLFADFWQSGLDLMAGRRVDVPPCDHLGARETNLTVAAAQMACSRVVADNVAKIVAMIRQAKAGGAGLVVFPELAVTGALAAEIEAAEQSTIEAAVDSVRQAAREARITVAFGTPWIEDGRRFNAAIVIAPDGSIATRYEQLVVDRPRLFTAGASTRAMWFEVGGVPAVITIGRDGLWNELAELAAVRGALVHLHLEYNRRTGEAASLARKQRWVNLASFRTLSVTVNAASLAVSGAPSAAADGGSIIWDDYHRGSRREHGGLGPFSAVPLAQADREEQLIFATIETPRENTHFERLIEINPQMKPWYETGGHAIYSELHE